MTETVELGPKSLRAIKALGPAPAPDAVLYTVVNSVTGTVAHQTTNRNYMKAWSETGSYDIYTSNLYLLKEEQK